MLKSGKAKSHYYAPIDGLIDEDESHHVVNSQAEGDPNPFLDDEDEYVTSNGGQGGDVSGFVGRKEKGFKRGIRSEGKVPAWVERSVFLIQYLYLSE